MLFKEQREAAAQVKAWEMKRPMPKEGDLRIWWIPQVPGKMFTQLVSSPLEGKRLLETLAMYDLFQLANRIKPDFANVGGLSVFDGEEWSDWYDDETGNDIGAMSYEELGAVK